MKYSRLFPKTKKIVPKGAESVNHQLLVRAGFMDQLMAGSWTLLPLGWKVVNKISDVIREELNKINCQEVLMPLLHPKSIWNETGRWESAQEIMYQLKDSRGKDFALSFTHEEIFLDLVRKQMNSYADLPVALYHFSTKFRNELRAKSGILRGREFLMKDLYSLHATQKDFDKFYKKVKIAYGKIFKRLGFDYKVTGAAGGVFTDNLTDEFQIVAEKGEDLIYFCDQCQWGQNQEIFKLQEGDRCPECMAGKIKSAKSIEVGNIFPLGTYYCEKMKVEFVDKGGKKQLPYFGSYGIGTTRVMGAWVEVSHDDKGIIWNEVIAPFRVCLVEIGKRAGSVYKKLEKAGIEVLWDDRDVSAGAKFADADLIGIGVRLVVSKKLGDRVEWKNRDEEKIDVLSVDEVIKRISG